METTNIDEYKKDKDFFQNIEKIGKDIEQYYTSDMEYFIPADEQSKIALIHEEWKRIKHLRCNTRKEILHFDNECAYLQELVFSVKTEKTIDDFMEDVKLPEKNNILQISKFIKFLRKKLEEYLLKDDFSRCKTCCNFLDFAFLVTRF